MIPRKGKASCMQYNCLMNHPPKRDTDPSCTTGWEDQFHAKDPGSLLLRLCPKQAHIYQSPRRHKCDVSHLAAHPNYCRKISAHIKCYTEQETDPVQNMTTSAANSLPFSNCKLFPVKVVIWLSFLSLILPSIISWLAPVSTNMEHRYKTGASFKKHRNAPR